MGLENKKIVLCRRREQAREMVLALQRRKAWPVVFPTFTLEPVGLSSEEQHRLQSLREFGWLVTGSQNGVGFLAHYLSALDVKPDALRHVKIGCVGTKTAGRWETFFPGIPVDFTAGSLQDLLTGISEREKGQTAAVLNPTSRQSLENISPDIPANLTVQRVAIYQALPDETHEPAEVDFIRSGNYDAIYFGSPSAFDYFLQIAGREPLEKQPVICVPGSTTAGHLERHGLQAAVIPETPDMPAVLAALENYFDKKTGKIPNDDRETEK